MFRMTLLSCMISSDLESEHHTNIWYDSFFLVMHGVPKFGKYTLYKTLYYKCIECNSFCSAWDAQACTFNMEII